MHEFHRDRGGYATVRRRPGRPRGQQRQRRAERLTRPAAVQPQVIGGDGPDLRAEPVHRRGNGRADEVTGGLHARGHHGGHDAAPATSAARVATDTP